MLKIFILVFYEITCDFVVCRSDICQFELWTGGAVLPRSFSLLQQVVVCLYILPRHRNNNIPTESISSKHLVSEVFIVL